MIKMYIVAQWLLFFLLKSFYLNVHVPPDPFFVVVHALKKAIFVPMIDIIQFNYILCDKNNHNS